MTAYITFFPIGNADATLIRLADDRLVMMDFAHQGNPDNPSDKRCDLPKEVRDAMDDAGQESFSAVAFTHLDDDHICKATEFFWLEHASKYQGGDRVKIDELWVPAAAIIEDGLEDEARIIRQEARYRLKQGKGIKVFSRPGMLKDFLDKNGIKLADRMHCIVDAGKLVPTFSINGPEKAEFFVHSPFASRTKEGELVDRNRDSIVVQLTMAEGANKTRTILGSDVDHEALTRIVNTTRRHGNKERLEWDILHLFHHCSYKSLSNEKGSDKTLPVPEVKWLMEEQSAHRAIVISPSKPIPAKGSKEDEDVQPPHRQAANYYKGVTSDIQGQFKVTMETPSEARPRPIRVKITAAGAAIMLAAAATATSAATNRPTRAG
ncbi:hypothetical protein [Roseibium sp.]|uniref:hypothetical protein n=1 Tax=Roseibium sp. TaxID=1936156 RepID=UPI00391C2200